MRRYFSIFGLMALGALGACQSSDISLLEPAQPQAQNPIAPGNSAEGVASGPPQSLENPDAGQDDGSGELQTAENNPNLQAPQQAPAGEEQPGSAATADGQQVTGAVQGSLSQAAGSAPPDNVSGAGSVEETPTRVEIQSDGGGFASSFRHEMNEMLGGTSGVRVNDVTSIQDDMVVGSWNLTEEDGLRTCSMAFASSDDTNLVQVTPGCSQVITTVSEWGVFGEDLLLRDAQNSVVVRLRRSASNWVGFTLANGIPIVLTR